MKIEEKIQIAAQQYFSNKSEIVKLTEQISQLTIKNLEEIEYRLKAVKSENEKAFSILYKLIEKPVYNTSRKILHSHEDSIDNVSKVMIKIYSNVNYVFDIDKPFLGYVVKVSHNSAKSEFNRRKRRMISTMSESKSEDGASAEEHLEILQNNLVNGFNGKKYLKQIEDGFSWADINWCDEEEVKKLNIMHQTGYLEEDRETKEIKLIKPINSHKSNTFFEESHHSNTPSPDTMDKFNKVLEFIRDKFSPDKSAILIDAIIRRLSISVDESKMHEMAESLTEMEEYSYEEIAAKHGFKSTGAIKTLVHRAKKQIREGLQEFDGSQDEDLLNGYKEVNHHNSSKLWFKCRLVNGEVHGKLEEYYCCGIKIKKTYTYNMGFKDELYTEFHKNGEVKKHGIYFNDKKHGIWTSYDEYGVKLELVDHYHGVAGYYELYENNTTTAGIFGYGEGELIIDDGREICEANIKEFTH